MSVKVGNRVDSPPPPDGLLRCAEPGWILAAMHDPASRRGLWFRKSDGVVELCSGREGDDHYVRLVAGSALAAEQVEELHELLDHVRWALDLEHGERNSDKALATLAQLVPHLPGDLPGLLRKAGLSVIFHPPCSECDAEEADGLCETETAAREAVEGIAPASPPAPEAASSPLAASPG